MYRRNKFRAIKTERDGYVFDSKKEAERYCKLALMQRAGEITGLALQQSFDLIVNGIKVCRYIADFVYEEQGKTIIEDVKAKATMTPVYRLKKKLMWACLNIKIRETL